MRKVKICGRIINVKLKTNILFLLIENNKIMQIVIKNNLEYFLNNLNVGDIVECVVTRDKNNNGKYKPKYDSFLLRSLKIISKNKKNYKLTTDKTNIIKYSDVKYEIRKYLHKLKYLEVALPILTDGEVSSKSESFSTLYSKKNIKLYLRKTMDIFLRMYSCCNFNKIYCIGNCYRNEYITSKCKPEFEMLSIFSNYLSKNDAIKLAIKITKIITSQDIEFHFMDEKLYNEITPNNNIFYVINNYTNSTNSYCGVLENDKTDEFKVKYKGVTVIHGVSEICNYDEYTKKIELQGKKEDYGELQILENLIDSGAPQCYNLGISVVRILSLYNNLKIKDYDIFSFDRLGGI